MKISAYVSFFPLSFLLFLLHFDSQKRVSEERRKNEGHETLLLTDVDCKKEGNKEVEEDKERKK